MLNFTFVIMDDYLPWTTCGQNNQFSGYQFDLLNYGLTQLQNSNNLQYNFLCSYFNFDLSVNDNVASIINNQSNIGVIGGLTINSDRYNLGYMFSVPTNTDSLIVLNYDNSSNEFILNSFLGMNVCIAFFLSLILIGILFFVYEKNYNADYRNNYFASIFQGFWQAYLIVFRMGEKIRSIASKFLELIVVATATAIISLLISGVIVSYKKEDFTQLNTPTHFMGSSAFTYKIYYDVILNYGIKVDLGGLPENSKIDDLLIGLKNNSFDYLILDASVLYEQAKVRCDYKVSSIDFFQFTMGIIMLKSPDNKELLKITNKALLLAQADSQYMSGLNDKYFNFGNICGASRSSFFENGESITDPIDYNTFLAIFIVFVIIIIIAMVAKLFERKMNVFFKNKKEIDKFIKKLNDVDSKILKKITIFFEILTEKWNNMVKTFEVNQAAIMENEKNCTFLIHDIYNKIYAMMNNPMNSLNLIDIKSQSPSINKSSLNQKKSRFLSCFGKKRESNFTIFEDFDLHSEEEKVEEKVEDDRLKQD